MNILYVTTIYVVGDGTSAAVYSQMQLDKNIYDDYLVVAKIIGSSETDLKITTNKSLYEITNFIKKGDICIHYFKGTYSNILMDILQLTGYNTPVITTICQVPSHINLWLTPYEIKHSWHFVFIDKAAYNNKLVDFIPAEKKSQIYCSGPRKDYSYLTKKKHGDKIIYGRGSTSIKCPLNMFDVFDQIDVPNKIFRIVGIENDSWIRAEAAKRNNVEVYGKLPKEQWLEMCNTFDVFLYHIPQDCHSSLDGTLGQAMLLGIPVVYMGSEAPKERFHDNTNGFVANSVDEMVYYATMLGKDEKLRKQIGENGRLSTIADFDPLERQLKYMELYKKVNSTVKIRIPFLYRLKFLRKNKNQAKIYLCGILRISFPKIYNMYLDFKKHNIQ